MSVEYDVTNNIGSSSPGYQFVLHEKLIVDQLARKFSAFHETRKFIFVLIKAHYWT
jgi:hypothetical protein